MRSWIKPKHRGPAVAADPGTIAAPPEIPPAELNRVLGAVRLPLSTARLVVGFTPVILAELASEAGAGASDYWFLDRFGRVLARDLAGLSDDDLRLMRQALLDSAASAARGAPAALDRLVAEMGSLPRGLRLELMRRLFEDGGTAPLSLALHGLCRDDRDAGRLEVLDRQGLVSIVVDGALEFPILMDGAVVPGFVPGWRAVAVVTCFPPFLMLRLQHEAGGDAVWVLDRGLNRIDDAAFATPAVRAAILEIAPALIRRYWQRLLALDDDRPDAELDALFRLGPDGVRQVFYACEDRVCLPVEQIVLEQVPEQVLLPPRAGQGRSVALRRSGIERAVTRSLYDAGIAALRSRRLTWPSPLDGTEAELEAVYPIQEMSILYQFRDRSGLRFLVIAAERDCVTLGILVPSANLAIGAESPPDSRFRGAVGSGIWHNLLLHCLVRHDAMKGRRRRADATIVNVFMGVPMLHIGHYVWNDLSGQLALAQDAAASLPTSVVFAGRGGEAELLGPLEELLPPLAGRVDRSLPDREAFIRWVHESGVVPIRFTRSYVSRAQRDLVQRATERSAEHRAVAAEIAARYRGRPIVMVGIRLDDRTFVDNDVFHAGLLEHLRRVRPDAVVVFDGRNSQPGGRDGEMIAGMKDRLAAVAPVVAEHELVLRLQQRFAGTGLSILSTVGQPVRTSLAWCYHACLCVSPWGAGLAKYRWLANLPSLVLTSRFNLEQRGDLDIYHSPRWMETPSELVFPDPSGVADRIDVVGLADSGMRVGRECFEVDLPHVCRLLDRLLATHAAAGAAAESVPVTARQAPVWTA